MITSFQEFVPLIMGNGASLRTGIKVKEMGCRKVLLVHGQGMKKSGIADNILGRKKQAIFTLLDY